MIIFGIYFLDHILKSFASLSFSVGGVQAAPPHTAQKTR